MSKITNREDLIELMSVACAKARVFRESGEELEEQFVDGLAARCIAEMTEVLEAIEEANYFVVPLTPTIDMVKKGHDAAILMHRLKKEVTPGVLWIPMVASIPTRK